ncbi:MAG: strawberry notch-like NTP hydrolase domain-containing protein, partial [Pseudomonadales bacterium]
MTDTYDFSDANDPFAGAVDPFANTAGPAAAPSGGLSDIKGFDQLDDEPVKTPTVGDLLKAGAKDLLTSKSNERSLELAERVAKPGSINTSDSGTLGFSPRSMQEQSQSYTDSGREVLRDKLVDQVDHTQQLQAEANEVPYSPSTQQFLNDKSENSAWSDFWADPVTIVKEVGLRSAPASVVSLAGGVAGAVATGGNPLGFAGGAGVVSARLEYGNSIMDALHKEGVDITSADDLIAAQKNPALMKRVKTFATERAEVVGAFDALAGGVAGKNVATFVAPGVKRTLANLGLQSATQAGLGAAGEAGAQYRTEGEISSPRGVAAEAVGEFITAPIDVAGATLSQVQESAQSRTEQRDANELAELDAQAQEWNADFDNANDPFLLTGTIAPEPEFVRPDEPVFNVDTQGNVDTSGAVAEQAKEAAKQAEIDKVAAEAQRAEELKSKTQFEWVQVKNNVGEDQTVLLDRATGEYHGDTSRLNIDDEQHRNEYEAKIQRMIEQRSEEKDAELQSATAEYDPNKVFAPPSSNQKPTEEAKAKAKAKIEEQEQATFDYLSSKAIFTPEQTKALYDYNEAEGKAAFQMDDKQADTLIEAARSNTADKEVTLYRSDAVDTGLKARHEFESRSLIPTTTHREWAASWGGNFGAMELSEITVKKGVPLVTVNQGNIGEKEVLLYGPDVVLEKVSERDITGSEAENEFQHYDTLVVSQYIARPKTADEKAAAKLSIVEDVEQLEKNIELAAQDTNTEPTPAQAEANNYKKGRFDFNGLKVAIENPKGSVRKGVDPDGNKWENEIKHHYGDISGVKGADGDNMDVFVGDNPASSRVFVIDQVDPKTGKFDEHKVMTGFDSLDEAKAGYLANYDKNWKGLGEISEIGFDDFKAWTKEGDTLKPFAKQAVAKQDVTEPPASAKPAITIEPLSDKAVLIKGVPKEMRAIMNNAGNVKAIWRRKEQAWMLPKKRLEKVMSELEQHFIMPGTTSATPGPVITKDAEVNAKDLPETVIPEQIQPEGLPKPEENLPIVENNVPESEVLESKSGTSPPTLDDVDSITDNRKLKSAIAAEQGVKASEVSDQMLKAGQEKLELALVGKARKVVESDTAEETGSTYKKLVDLYQAQPNLNVRSSTSMENQAYSTPAPLSFLASKLAGITKDSTVYEPTAGNGMLLIGAAHKHVTANELNDLRAEQLRAQGFTVTQNDATSFVPAEKVDAVIMNPPFGKLRDANGSITPVKVDGYTIKSIDHLIAAKALEAMKDDGRASIIIGASKKEGDIGPSDRTFFNWLYSHYNVTDHFEVDGDLYKRQGAGWPVRVITIDGRVESKNISPVSGSIERVRSWDEVYDRYTESVDSSKTGFDRSRSESVNGTDQSDSSNGQTSTEVEDGREDGNTDQSGSGTKSGRSRDTGNNTGSSASSSRKRNTESASPSDDRSGKPERVDLQSESEPEERSTSRRSSDVNESVPKRSTGRPAARDRKPSVKSSGFQSNYVTRSSGSNEAVLTPVNMSGATERALSALEADVGNIDDYVIDKLGYNSIDELHKSFMGLQVDTIAAGVYNIEKGKGIIIADQTGVGKGRQAAGIIRYALREGKIPVFISVKDNLFTDMYNDLKDIGTTDVRPFILNQDAVVKSGDESLFKNPTRNNHLGRISDVISTGEL